MKNKLVFLSLLLSSLMMISCGGKVENNPEKIAEAVVKHLQAEEFEEMKQYCNWEGTMNVEFFASMFRNTPLEKGLSQSGKTIHKLVKAKNVKLDNVSVGEDKADIKYKFQYEDKDSWQSLTMKFKKEEEIWKIVEFK